MTQPDPTDVLNRLLRLLHRSLAVYLDGTRPWLSPGGEDALSLLRRMAADHRRDAERLVAAIREAGARPEFGSFPVAFTAVHDLSLDYLLGRLIEAQQRGIQVIDQCVADLSGFPRCRALAEEILGNAQGYLEMLEEVGNGEKSAQGQVPD
jgi:hypothetical protein